MLYIFKYIPIHVLCIYPKSKKIHENLSILAEEHYATINIDLTRPTTFCILLKISCPVAIPVLQTKAYHESGNTWGKQNTLNFHKKMNLKTP